MWKPVLPERTFAWVVARRALAIWPGVHLLAAAVTLLASPRIRGLPALLLSPGSVPFTVPATVLLTVLETRHRNEHLLLANLGTGPAGIVLLASLPPLAWGAALALLAAA